MRRELIQACDASGPFEAQGELNLRCETLVTTLGGIWGRSTLEDKFERFERAIFTTIQRPDETHESYLARHDFQFEELLQMGVGFKEMRAYILLRNSGLNAEDKKKLIVDSQGNLAYEEIVSSLKLLGSKFFHEVQSGSKTSMRSKTYDVNVALEEEWGNNDDDVAFMGETWMNPKFHTMKVIQMRWFAFNLKTVWWMPFKVTRTLPYAIMHTWTNASV